MTELTFPRAHPDSDDPAELDLFSGSRFTKHCKRGVVGSSFGERRTPGDTLGDTHGDTLRHTWRTGFRASTRPYDGSLELTYPFHDRDEIVAACGRRCLHRKRIDIATGRRLGIKQVDDGMWLVGFMYDDLGYFDLEQKTCNPSTTRSARGCHPCPRYDLLPMCPGRTLKTLERVKGIEASYSAWKSTNFARRSASDSRHLTQTQFPIEEVCQKANPCDHRRDVDSYSVRFRSLRPMP
jgi:hypothetical protein